MRTAIIGAGWIAEEHAAILRRLEGVEVSAVCDVDLDRARSLAGDGAVYADWRELLERDSPDCVLVCTPPLLHREPATEALSRGIHVYLEKPIARGLDDARAIVEAAAAIVLRFASGAVGSSTIAWTRDGLPGKYSLDVLGDESSLHLELDPDFTLTGVSRGRKVESKTAQHPIERGVERFLAASRDGDAGRVFCTPRDALGTLAAVIACEEALATGAAVRV